MKSSAIQRSLLLAIISLSLHSVSLSQESRINYLSFGFGPVGIADPISQSFNLVIEKNLSNKFTFEVTYGLFPEYIFSPSNVRNSDIKQHEYRTSFRFIPQLSNLEKNSLFFLGIEYSGVYQRYIDRMNDYTTLSGEDLIYESARVRRVVNGLRLESGVKLIRGWKELEIYAGVGARDIDVQHSEVIPIEDPSQDLGVNYVHLTEGNYYKLDLHVGIKLCYTIRKYK